MSTCVCGGGGGGVGGLCVCLCVCARARARVHACVFAYVRACVCVCECSSFLCPNNGMAATKDCLFITYRSCHCFGIQRRWCMRLHPGGRKSTVKAPTHEPFQPYGSGEWSSRQPPEPTLKRIVCRHSRNGREHRFQPFRFKYRMLWFQTEDVPLVEFMYLVFTRMPGESLP